MWSDNSPPGYLPPAKSARGRASSNGARDFWPDVSATRDQKVARPERASFEVAELVEHEERVVACASEVAVPNTLLLLAVG
jgi:hypothetical protein